jgi:hypothetical protein
MTSKWSAAMAPSSRMSSSRRSPAVAIIPILDSLPSSVVAAAAAAVCSTKSPSMRIPGALWQ